MIMGDKKKTAMLIAARVSPKGDIQSLKNDNARSYSERAKGFERPAPKHSEGILAASEEMIEAMHARDADGFASALKDFIAISEGKEDEPEAEEPSESV